MFAQSLNITRSYFSSMIVIGAFSLLIPALAINITAIAWYIQGEIHGSKPWANIVLAVVLTIVIISVIILVIVDQYPCWMGVPNCD